MIPKSKTALPQPLFTDSIISAELDSDMNPFLGEVSLKENEHTFCEAPGLPVVCMDDGTCIKRFPKVIFLDPRLNDAELYVSYRKRALDDGEETYPRICWAPRKVPAETTKNVWVVLLLSKDINHLSPSSQRRTFFTL